MKQRLNEVKSLQKTAGLIKESEQNDFYITVSVRDAKSALEILRDEFSREYRNKIIQLDGTNGYVIDDRAVALELYDAFKLNGIEIEQSDVDVEDDDYDDDFGDEDDYGPVSDYSQRRKDDDAAYHGLGEESVRMWKSDNPEGDQMVMDFLKMIAQEFDYPPEKGNPLVQAADFVKGRLKKLGYINEIDRNDPILMQTRANAYQKSLPKPKPTKIKTSMVIKNASEIKQLIADLKELEADLKELEREQDIEAGQLGDKWTDEKANEYGERMNDILDQIKALRDQIKALSGQGEQGSETNTDMDKAEIERRAAMVNEAKENFLVKGDTQVIIRMEDAIQQIEDALDQLTVNPTKNVKGLTKYAMDGLDDIKELIKKTK